jgi:hypothetical protein
VWQRSGAWRVDLHGPEFDMRPRVLEGGVEDEAWPVLFAIHLEHQAVVFRHVRVVRPLVRARVLQ